VYLASLGDVRAVENKPALTLLLDECVTLRFEEKSTDNNVKIFHSIKTSGLGPCVSDDKILMHLLKHDYDLFVTRDLAFYNICRYQCVRSAFYVKGWAYDYGSIRKIYLGQDCDNDAIRIPLSSFEKINYVYRRYSLRYKRKGARRLFRLARLFAKMLGHNSNVCDIQRSKTHIKHNHKAKACRITLIRKPDYIGELAIMPARFCACGQFCYTPERLRNHVKNSHFAELSPAT
jgi:hypothetical protein